MLSSTCTLIKIQIPNKYFHKCSLIQSCLESPMFWQSIQQAHLSSLSKMAWCGLWGDHSCGIHVTRAGVIYPTELLHCTRNDAHLSRVFFFFFKIVTCVRKTLRRQKYSTIYLLSPGWCSKMLTDPLPSSYLKMPKPW